MDITFCKSCCKEIVEQDAAIKCELCNRFCHILCNTGISSDIYDSMIDGDIEISWICKICKIGNKTSIDYRTFIISSGIIEPMVINHICEPVETVENQTEISYSIMEGDSLQTADILIDNLGYLYTEKIDKRSPVRNWRCKFYNGQTKCKRFIKESNGIYIPRPLTYPHRHTCSIDQR